jgi:hypothetical protein
MKTWDSTIQILKSAQRRLEQNAHLVKAGDPRDQIMFAISEIAEAIFQLTD